MSWPKKVVFPTESTNVTYRHWYVPSIVCISHNFQINWSGLFGNFTLKIVCTLNDSIEECVLAEPSFGFALRRQPSSSCAFLKWTQANLELCKEQTVDFLKGWQQEWRKQTDHSLMQFSSYILHTCPSSFWLERSLFYLVPQETHSQAGSARLHISLSMVLAFSAL